MATCTPAEAISLGVKWLRTAALESPLPRAAVVSRAAVTSAVTEA
jgi:hypothetical protein